ncbi:MAG: hypothetical protein HXY35_09200 [Chloroflexi bacterium]|nr:hypothetical protein [Chloroflexota bacterium]
MSESEQKQAGFLGTYFDRDSVMRLSRWADGFSWVVLVIYLISWISSVLMFFAQYYNGMFFEKGMTFLNVINFFTPYLTQPIPGLFYFFGLQAISKGVLILMDTEDNTRRAARK